MDKRNVRNVLFCIALSAALFAGGRPFWANNAHAGNVIEPGFDLFKTDPAQTSFAMPPIPAGFFGPGCEPFSGSVQFGGSPIGTFGGHDVGDADTIVHRIDPVNVPPAGSTSTVPIEIVALNLVSVQPITIRCNQTPEQWNVQINLSVVPQQTGGMTIHSNTTSGGTFDASLPVTPGFIFTRVGGGTPIVLDAGIPSTSGGIIGNGQPLYILQQTGTPWITAPHCPHGILKVSGLTSNFCASVTQTGIVETHSFASSPIGVSQHSYNPVTHKTRTRF